MAHRYTHFAVKAMNISSACAQLELFDTSDSPVQNGGRDRRSLHGSRMDRSMDKVLLRPVVVVALAAACTTYARTGSGHGSTSSGHGHGCVAHSASQHGHPGKAGAPHDGASTVHRCPGGGGAAYGASYGNRNSAVYRELHERIVKTQQAKEAFMKSHPCPANGMATGNCPGFRIDCIDPNPAEPARCQDASNLEWRPVQRSTQQDAGRP
jgi:hypothetical protein